MINWLRQTSNIFVCVFSSNDAGLELKYFSDLDLKEKDINGESIKIDLEKHIKQLAEHIGDESEEFMLYCNLLINEKYEYQISAGDLKTMDDHEKFVIILDSIVRRIDECFSESIPFTFSFDYMDFDYDDAPTRYIYQYIKV